MDLATSAWHIVSAAIVFLLAAAFTPAMARYFQVPASRALFLYAWHTAFCLFYMDFSIKNVSDALGYFHSSLGFRAAFEPGTVFVQWFTSIFSVHLGMSYMGVFLVFNIFGFIGLLAFCGALRVATENKSRLMRRLGFLILLLPSVSFWSAAIGKDALSFMATGLALWAALDFRKRTLLLIFAIVVMLLVRPHMAALMVLAFVFSTIFNPRISLLQRATLGTVAIAGAAVMLPFAITYVGLGNASNSGDVMAYIEQRQAYNQEGGGGIDIAAMSPPMQLFTYLFRPLPFEAHSLFSLAASFDNVLLLILFVVGGRRIFGSGGKDRPENRPFLLAYAFSSWLILALTTANMGISVRQKWMFTPVLIYLLLSAAREVRRVPATHVQAVAAPTFASQRHDAPGDGWRVEPPQGASPL